MFILLLFVAIVAVFGASFVVLRVIYAAEGKRAQWLSAAMFFMATLVPVVVTLMTPRTGSSAGYTAFADAPQSPLMSLIIRLVGYSVILLVPLMVLAKMKSALVVPGVGVALLVYAATGVASAIVNAQPVRVDLLYPALAVTGVLIASHLSQARALWMARTSLRIYVWLSLALAIVAPGLVFWEGQGRTWFGLSQLAGVTAHPNGMGTIAALAVMVELVRVDGVRRARVLHLLAAVAALLMTQSRGSWLSAAVGILVYAAFRFGPRVVIVGMPVILAAGWAASTLITGVADSLVNWSGGGNFATLNGRTTIWMQSLDAVRGSPMFGTGPESFSTAYRTDLLGLGNLLSSSNAHNQVVQTLVERGAFGLVALIVLVVVLFRKALSAGAARAGLLAMFAIFITRFIVETPLNISTASLNGAVLVIVAVLISALGARGESDDTISLSTGTPAQSNPKLLSP